MKPPGEQPFKDIIRSLGLVYGDIGTSPIYTLPVTFLLLPPTEDNVMGIVSLVVWTLVTLVTVEYAWLAMSLGEKGEGGTIVLREKLLPLLKTGRHVAMASILTFIGISLFIGDGVITPAISILSAVEGARLIPGLEQLDQRYILLIAVFIAVGLFWFQKKGTDRVSFTFGPLMLVWFSTLAVIGLASLVHMPSILAALSPYYAVSFLLHHGLAGFFVLSEVILCATGGEALYADMGHLSRKPIVSGWVFVFVVLLLNYLGQAVFIVQHPSSRIALFEMVHGHSRVLYIPFLILSICATIIASQAMVSGLFSIIYQAINKRIMPWLRIEYTSERQKSQIYIGTINWLLLAAVVFIMLRFEESSKLAAAYGMAVTGTMTITGIFMTWIFFLTRKRLHLVVAAAVTCVDLLFLLSNSYKLPHGGYWSLIIACFPLAFIVIYVLGQKRVAAALQPIDRGVFLREYEVLYTTMSRIKGTAVFLASNFERVPPYIAHVMFKNCIVYGDNIIVSLFVKETPFGVKAQFKETLAPGLRRFEIRMGYMEILDFGEILRQAGIQEKSIFYGLEDIVSGNLIWRIYAVIEKLTPSFVQFYKLPPDRLHGVVVRAIL